MSQQEGELGADGYVYLPGGMRGLLNADTGSMYFEPTPPPSAAPNVATGTAGRLLAAAQAASTSLEVNDVLIDVGRALDAGWLGTGFTRVLTALDEAIDRVKQ